MAKARRPSARVRRNGASVSVESRAVLVHPATGAPWSTAYRGDRDAMLFLLQYPPFVEALRTGRGLSAVAVRLGANERYEVFIDRLLRAQTDPVVGQLYRDFARRYPEHLLPPPSAIEDLVVVDVPGALPFRLHASDGDESIEVFDPDEWI